MTVFFPQHTASSFDRAPKLPCVDDLVASFRPTEPLICLRPATLVAAAEDFVAAFPGQTMYAVKCNPDPIVLRALWDGGVRHFDCASIAEVELIRGMFPNAGIYFMHPIKARPAIADAYRLHDVRCFVFDSAVELEKILGETGDAGDLDLVVRLALPPLGAVSDLSAKFGAPHDEAVALLRAARPHALRLGVSFHVGSQCLDPLAWRRAIALAGAAIAEAGVAVDVLDIGGGFPVPYPGMEPPPLGAFMAEIDAGVEALNLPMRPHLWAEPGRALVAAGVSVVVQVQGRRGNALYINDGVFGSLSDAGPPGFRYPVRLMRPTEASLQNFACWGPTCDSNDFMRGPFVLPGDAHDGDWVEIGQLGAYSTALRTRFNGFDRARVVEVRDGKIAGTE
ncbi:MAG: type III PLP-dependent enzyme [Rhodospirillales bacterium]